MSGAEQLLLRHHRIWRWNRTMAWHLATGRLLMRGFTAADADWLAALHGDPAVMRYIDDVRPAPGDVVSAQTLPASLGENRELPGALGFFTAAAKARGRPIRWFWLTPHASIRLTPRS